MMGAPLSETSKRGSPYEKYFVIRMLLAKVMSFRKLYIKSQGRTDVLNRGLED